ncbi:MAG TPA: D-tyrosyl-tRNA(Tyr) deacylase [Ruminococcaceae bacterium]|nr:D-tyrosyl-tRNA(Tyr) deacylase [Oscillospiraceae bacterium]
MVAVIQRVSRAGVAVDEKPVSEIGKGLLVLLGVAQGDAREHAELLAKKTAELRVFEDEAGKMNLSALDVGGEILVVSNFTLCADCSHGRRPSFIKAAAPEKAELLYAAYADALTERGVKKVATGVFGGYMEVSMKGDGPVTICLDTDRL